MKTHNKVLKMNNFFSNFKTLLQSNMVAVSAGGAASEAYMGKFVYKYKDGPSYRVIAEDAQKITWECIEGDELGAHGVETPQRFKVSKNVFFVTWVEKDGVIVSQVLDFDDMNVFATIVVGADRYVLEGKIIRE